MQGTFLTKCTCSSSMMSVHMPAALAEVRGDKAQPC